MDIYYIENKNSYNKIIMLFINISIILKYAWMRCKLQLKNELI